MIPPIIQDILRKGIEEKQFTACALGIRKMGGPPLYTAIGNTDLEQRGESVDEDTLFDLASLTKVMFTTTLAARLLECGEIQIEIPLKDHPGLEQISTILQGSAYENCTFEDLLLHRAGFPVRADFSEICPSLYDNVRNYDVDIPLHLIECISKIAPVYEARSKNVYCDPGFIMLAETMSILRKESSENLWRNEIQVPWNLYLTKHSKQFESDDVFAISAKDLGPGEVQDPEVRYIRKLCGHSGLFGSIADLMSFGEIWLHAYLYGNEYLSKETARRFVDPYLGKADSRLLGWDGVSENSTAGAISKKSIGHLGYTGTSLWIDLEHGMVVGLLTNRTLTALPNSNEFLTKDQIRSFNDFRREVHNAIWRMFLP